MAEEREIAPNPRAFWSGTLTFGLVSVPVDLYPAVRSRRIALRMLGPGNQPLVRRYFCSVDGKALSNRTTSCAATRTTTAASRSSPTRSSTRSRRASRATSTCGASCSARRFRGSCSSGRTCWRPPASRRRRITCSPRRWSARGRAGIATFVMRGKEYLAAIFAEGGSLRAVTMRFAERAAHAGRRRFAGPGAGRRPSGAKRSSARSPSSTRTSSTSKLLDDEYATRCSSSPRRSATPAATSSRSRRRRPRTSRSPPTSSTSWPCSSSAWAAPRASRRARNRPRAPAARPRHRRPRADDALADKSKKELYEQAKKLGVEGRSAMSREELIAALRKAGCTSVDERAARGFESFPRIALARANQLRYVEQSEARRLRRVGRRARPTRSATRRARRRARAASTRRSPSPPRRCADSR